MQCSLCSVAVYVEKSDGKLPSQLPRSHLYLYWKVLEALWTTQVLLWGINVFSPRFNFSVVSRSISELFDKHRPCLPAPPSPILLVIEINPKTGFWQPACHYFSMPAERGTLEFSVATQDHFSPSSGWWLGIVGGGMVTSDAGCYFGCCPSPWLNSCFNS